jgi:hypothetical protein
MSRTFSALNGFEWSLANEPRAIAGDYSKALGNVFEVWKLKSPTDAATWLQTARLDDPIRSELLRGMEPQSVK